MSSTCQEPGCPSFSHDVGSKRSLGRQRQRYKKRNFCSQSDLLIPTALPFFFHLHSILFTMISAAATLILSSLFVAGHAQQAGTQTTETHPSLTVSECTASGCTTSDQSIVIDANWRWVHTIDGYTNCYTGNEWDETICTDGETCAANCALDGAEYEATYGITTSGDALTLAFVTSDNVGSRNYLMAAGSETEYQMLQLLGKEFSFDVDVSNLPCGLNGALYLAEMDADGGTSRFSGNAAGAKYGTGYCDAQCPRDVKFISGVVSDDNSQI